MGISPTSTRHEPGLTRAVFLDRDGVLNVPVIRDGKPYPPPDPGCLVLYADAAASCEMLQVAGFLLVMVTNQPDVARGSQSQSAVEAMNNTVRDTLHLDAVYTCFHDDEDACGCRKPKPGLLLKAAKDLAIDLVSSFMIGDRWRDIEAGWGAGCKTIWINRNYRETTPPHPPDREVTSLQEAVRWIDSQVLHIQNP